MIIKATELKQRGLTDAAIRQLCHMKGSPFFRTSERGRWRVDTDKLDKFLDKLSERKENYA